MFFFSFSLFLTLFFLEISQKDAWILLVMVLDFSGKELCVYVVFMVSSYKMSYTRKKD